MTQAKSGLQIREMTLALTTAWTEVVLGGNYLQVVDRDSTSLHISFDDDQNPVTVTADRVWYHFRNGNYFNRFFIRTAAGTANVTLLVTTDVLVHRG